MKKILFIICVACALFSCTKKDPAVVPGKDPWVQVYKDDWTSYFYCIRDTFILGRNITYSSYTMPYFYTGIIENGLTSFRGYSVPYDNPTSGLASYDGDLFAGTFGHGVYVSKDLGKTWEAKNNGLPSSYSVMSIAASDMGVFVSGSKLHFSDDKGDNWVDISIPNMVYSTTATSIGNTFFASVRLNTGSNNVLFSSVDDGANWTQNTAISNGDIYKFAVLYGRLYAVSFSNNLSTVYVSSDDGQTWVKANGLGNTMNSYFNAFESHNGTVYVGGTNGVYKSTDNGLNWTYLGCSNIRSLAIKNNSLYAAKNDGIWKLDL